MLAQVSLPYLVLTCFVSYAMFSFIGAGLLLLAAMLASRISHRCEQGDLGCPD